MKNIKKIFALIFTLVMMMGLGSVAFAAEGSITVGTLDNDDHKFTAYQIFTGDLHEGVLSDITWGGGITSEGQIAVQNAYSVTTAGEVANKIGNTLDAENFAKAVAPYLTGGILLKNGTSTTVPVGYYLVKETTTPSGAHAASTYILHVVGAVTLNPKSSIPTSDKKQSYTDGSGYTHEVLDVNIGDTVYYELTGTMPNTLADYNTYKYVFHDTLSKGLTYNAGSVAVNIDGTTITPSSYAVTSTTVNEETKLTITFTNIKSVPSVTVTKDSVVKVYYSAKLNKDAVIGLPGNSNISNLEFSNNPTWNGTGTEPTGVTPEVKVVVFTFQINANKQDNDDENKKLQGAQFVLKNADKSKYVMIVEGKVSGWTSTKTEASTIVSDASGNFSFIGLDAGTYYLEETQAPSGYHTLAGDVEIKIIPTYNAEKTELTGLKADVGSIQVAGEKDTGSIDIVIRNSKGNSLPSTGGVGTTLFYVFGAILVVIAGVLLITKKRMSAK